jgi:hypothetical protein
MGKVPVNVCDIAQVQTNSAQLIGINSSALHAFTVSGIERMQESQPKSQPNSNGNLILSFGLVIALVLGGGAWLQGSLIPQLKKNADLLEKLNQRCERIESWIALQRFSGNPEGKPEEEVIQGIEYWANRLQRRGSSVIERELVKEYMDHATVALKGLKGRGIRAAVRAFWDPKNRNKQEFRRSLLLTLDKIGAKEIIEITRKALETPGVPSQLRVLAAGVLKKHNAELAGQILAQVLLSESLGGPRHPLPGKAIPDNDRKFPGFFDLIPIFKETPYAQKGEILLQVLSQAGEDVATKNQCVKALEEIGYQPALPSLKKMFGDGNSARNPLLRMNIARAIARIGKKKSCKWLEEKIRFEGDNMVLNRLKQLYSRYCSK